MYRVFQTNDQRFEVDAAGGTLTIDDVRLGDQGNYVCVVNTTAQPIVTSTNAHLYVESECRLHALGPTSDVLDWSYPYPLGTWKLKPKSGL